MPAPVHRLQRVALFVAIYGVLAALSLWFAYQLRFLGADEPTTAAYVAFEAYLSGQRPYALLWVIPLKVVLLGLAGQLRGVFYYFRLPDALRMGAALSGAMALMLLVPLLTAGTGFGRYFAIPRGVTLVDFHLSLILFIGFRVFDPGPPRTFRRPGARRQGRGGAHRDTSAPARPARRSPPSC